MKRLLRIYLCGHWKGFLAFLLACGLFVATFALYHLPLYAVLYPAALCLIFGVLWIVVDLLRQRTRHLRLVRQKPYRAETLPPLPAPHSIAEADALELIAALKTEVAELRAAAETQQKETMEYYTVWVHQIKTPIASMRLQLRNEDSASARQLLSELLRIEQYVEMVLTFLRLHSGSGDYVFRRYSLDGMIRSSVRRFSGDFIGKRLTLEYEPIAVSFVTDEKWFSFVLEQILSNALKYTSEGGIRIFLSAPDTLCVSDTGIGVLPQDLPRVFENGYTGQNGRDDHRATGIGLYLCKRICDNLGIGLWMESKPGTGTSVFLKLPQYEIHKE